MDSKKGKGRAIDLQPSSLSTSTSAADLELSPPAISTAMAAYHSEIPDLALPLPSIPTPVPEITAGTIAAEARRRLSLFSSPSFSATASPRTRFDLSSPVIHPSQLASLGPLKPILNPPHAPHPKPIVYETDFLERQDGEVHPERSTQVEEKRTPHPMYTPVDPARRRRRRKARSVASGRTGRSGRSGKSSKGASGFVRGAWKSLKKRSIRRFDTRSSIGHSSGSSSTDTSRSSGSNSTCLSFLSPPRVIIDSAPQGTDGDFGRILPLDLRPLLQHHRKKNGKHQCHTSPS